MDKKTFVTGPTLKAEWLRDFTDAAADQLSSTARHALDGCVFGLTPTAAQTHVQEGEAYIGGNRLRLRANHAIDIAGLTRPTGTQVAWVTVLASYTTDGNLTVTDDQGVQHVLCVDDGIIISLSRGADAANKAAAVKPSVPTGSIVLCDILLDASTAVGSLDGDPSRRPQCPDDELRTESDLQWDAIRALQATQAASLQSPNKGPTPTATSTVALRIDATWAVGTVDAGVPAITKAKFRWRQSGENWADNRTIALGDVQARNFTVPDADSDVQMQVQYGNGNGFGVWSDTGTITADNIFDPPALTARTFTADTTYAWPYPQSQRARLMLTGGSGAGGAGGSGGGGAVGLTVNGGGGAGGGPNGGGGGGATTRAGRQGEDGGDATAGAEGGDGATNGSNGGAGVGTAQDGNDGTLLGGGGGDGSPGSGGGGAGVGGGGGGGGPNGGDGGDAGGHESGGAGVGGSGNGGGGEGQGLSGGGGGGGGQGSPGAASRVVIDARSFDSSATGGDGGSGGGGGGGGHRTQGDGDDGADATSSGGGGSGGAGGPGGTTSAGDGGSGGAGAAGDSGQQVIVDVSGLQVGDSFTITIGGGGNGSDKAAGYGGGLTAASNGANGANGSDGSAGRVVLTPLT